MAIFFWMRVIELRIWHQVIFGQSMWKEYNRMTANIQMSSIEFFNRLWIVGWSSKILSVFFICCQPGDSITLGIYIYIHAFLHSLALLTFNELYVRHTDGTIDLNLNSQKLLIIFNKYRKISSKWVVVFTTAPSSDLK